jgi:glyceraldehyde 3-phosphate dehydrogenase
VDGKNVTVGKWKVFCFAERDPKQLKWADHGVDIVVESTGIFRSAKDARVHIDSGGAKKVIISAPAKDQDMTIVMGVNHNDYNPKKHHVVSNASCTTNCLAPVAKVIYDTFGIKSGIMTTIHSYTNDQRILDTAHSDLRRARSAGGNIIPTSTGAAQAVAEVIPALKGKFTGYALRVPTPTVSLVDFSVILEKETTTEGLRKALKTAAKGPLKGIMDFCEKQLVSMDFKGDPHSSIVDAEYTTVQDKTFAKIVSWYDNEWGYSCRVADLCMYFQKKGF